MQFWPAFTDVLYIRQRGDSIALFDVACVKYCAEFWDSHFREEGRAHEEREKTRII